MIKQYGDIGVNKYREMNDPRIVKGFRVIKREGVLVFIQRFSRFLKRKLLIVLTPFVIALTRPGKFLYNKERLTYFRHVKTVTWTNERAIEIPIIMNYIKKFSSKKILEVGAVLPQYFPKIKKDTIDKFEKGKNIMNIDVLDYKPIKKYDLIVSISTLEHVGYDDDVKNPKGTINAVNALKENCLATGGKMVITLPIGYNQNVDKLIFSNELAFDEKVFFKKKNAFNKWQIVSPDKAKGAKFGKENAETVVIGVINK
jgi:hypothetical protein